MSQKRIVLSLMSALVLSLVATSASAAEVFLYSSFKMHDFDEEILEALGHETGNVLYLREMASLTVDQRRVRDDYEKFGCFPYQLLRDGEVDEVGYNCQTFFCVGYLRGPKICMDRNNKIYGGVVEINKRLNTVQAPPVEKNFSSFADADKSEYMKKRIAELSRLQCTPFYQMLFDVAVGEGYRCDEVGQYPYYSSKNYCVNDWRTPEGIECDVPQRDDEFELRAKAIAYRGGRNGSSVSSMMSEESSSSLSSSPSSSAQSSASPRSFNDVIEGHYGYTAIIDLAQRGIVSGYEDGTYRPYNIVNRAEFSKLLMGGLHKDHVKSEARCFPDVSREWFSSFVCAAKRLQWLAGYPDGNFYPSRTIKKSEAMKIIVESIGVPLDSTASLPAGTPDGQWYSPYIRKAMELKLILEPSFNPGADVTRADAAVWIYRSLKASGK